MRLKFIGNNTYHTMGSDFGEWCVINPAYFLLRYFYLLRGKANKLITWLPADLIHVKPFSEQIKQLNNENIDVLCMSVHIWNEKTQFKLAKEFKQANPESVVILGGPQLTAHKDKGFFKEHPYVDWVVYGDGEKAFQLILDKINGFDADEQEWCNCVTLLNNNYKLYPYKMIDDHVYLSGSPYLEQKELVAQHLDQIENEGIPRNQIKVAVEFARGCMYRCSFCDWQQNLTKKVKRRSANFKAELDFFKQLNVSVRESDANFGQWPEDIEIFDYANSITETGKNFYFVPKNVPKLKKESIKYIIEQVFLKQQNFNAKMHISFQDIDQNVLELIDRPSLSWDEYLEIISYLRETISYDLTEKLGAQTIVGLPGQTFDGYARTIQTIWNTAKLKRFDWSPWELLPNSPGADKKYINDHEIKTVQVKKIQHTMDLSVYPKIKNLDDLAQELNKVQDINHMFADSMYVDSTKYLSPVEMCAITFIKEDLEHLCFIKKTRHFNISDDDLHVLKKVSLERAKNHKQKTLEFENKWGYRINANMVKNNILTVSHRALAPFTV